MFTVAFREEGRGKEYRHSFSKLEDLQKYVRDRWEGPDYIEGPSEWHTDYAAFRLIGCTLADLGSRRGAYGTDGYYDWDWKVLGVPAQVAP